MSKRVIPSFPDYEITERGRIWSKPKKMGRFGNIRHEGKWLEPIRQPTGYDRVSLCIEGKTINLLVHRLVLETYVGPCPAGMEACHNNGDRTDNRLENLRWDTKKNNSRDAATHGTQVRGEEQGAAKLTTEKVRIIKYLRDKAKFTLKDLAWQFDVSSSTVWAICTGKSWKHMKEMSYVGL